MEPLRPGDPSTIGPWQLQSRIGAGGMGVVYLASRDDEQVALKVVRSHFLDDPSLRERFTREVDTLHRVQSPFIATVIDADTTGELAWVATEFVNGPNLKVRVEQRGPLLAKQWESLARGLLEALDATHEVGVVHRDVKPANILLAGDTPKLIDFGIAQASDATSLTTTGLIAGSPAWLSPEQINDTAIGPASDLFSAGSVLAFAATGRQPWGPSGLPPAVVLARITTDQPDIEGVSDLQASIIEGLLRKDPVQRLTARRALALLPSLAPPPQVLPPVLPAPSLPPPSAPPPSASVASAPPPSAPPPYAAPSPAPAQPSSNKLTLKIVLGVVGAAAISAIVILSVGNAGNDSSGDTVATAETTEEVVAAATTEETVVEEAPVDPSYRTRVEYANDAVPAAEFESLTWVFDICVRDRELLQRSVLDKITLSRKDGDAWNRVPARANASAGGRCEGDQVNVTIAGSEPEPLEFDTGFGACQRYRVGIPETKLFARSNVDFCVRSAGELS